MNANISCLVRACNRLSIPHEILHDSGNFLKIELHGTTYFFVNWSVPLNRQDIARICLDKDFCHRLLEPVIPMPTTAAFLSPAVQSNYRQYLKLESIEAVRKAILNDFPLPVVVKRNRGSHGSHVFRCDSSGEVEEALEAIFNVNQREYDYVALAQQCLEIRKEYRVIVLEGEVQFAYEKSTEGAAFTGNLSPLHWENARAVLEQDAETLEQIQSFVKPIFDRFPLRYGGLDLVLDLEGRWWLLEINASPSYSRFVRDNGPEVVVKMYERVLGCLRGEGSQPISGTEAAKDGRLVTAPIH